MLLKTKRQVAAKESFEESNDNYGKYINAWEWVTTDGCLYKYHNQWAGKVYNPHKPNPFYINFKLMNEVIFPYKYIINTFSITKRLLEKYDWERLKDSKLTTDNLYGSIPLVKLILQKNMQLIRTISSNRLGIGNEGCEGFKR